MKINFSKVVATGNDFILIDNRKNIIKKDNYAELASKLCARKYSIGADGLIFIEKSIYKDFKMKYLNCDGSYAAMCGNGGRSVAKFMYALKAVNYKMEFETDAGTINAEIFEKNIVKLNLYKPKNIKQNIKLKFETHEINVDFIDTGVPHIVIFVDDIEKIDILKYGKKIRYHKIFAPLGVNVNFVKIVKDNILMIRTYERGVEDETLACGTGVIAVGIISYIKGYTKLPTSIITRSGEKLYVSFEYKNSEIFNVILEGPAFIAFKGMVEI
ncbi:MAG: diaminopimelate epimerase [Endomicrobium sp.]|jgi:diaminopimelate epimerase|nr:diaminopimelate epimerase [Endomicrobium sp.]